MNTCKTWCSVYNCAGDCISSTHPTPMVFPGTTIGTGEQDIHCPDVHIEATLQWFVHPMYTSFLCPASDNGASIRLMLTSAIGRTSLGGVELPCAGRYSVIVVELRKDGRPPRQRKGVGNTYDECMKDALAKWALEGVELTCKDPFAGAIIRHIPRFELYSKNTIHLPSPSKFASPLFADFGQTKEIIVDNPKFNDPPGRNEKAKVLGRGPTYSAALDDAIEQLNESMD